MRAPFPPVASTPARRSVSRRARIAAACLALPCSLVFANVASADEAPNFSGVWEDVSSSQNAPPTETLSGEELQRELFGARTAPGGEPSLKEPFAAAYKERKRQEQEAALAGTPLSDPHEQCIPEGMPQFMMPTMPIEIAQLPDKIIIVTEYLGQVRRIFLNEAMPEAEDLLPSYVGHSVGHWQGDTLVVETRGIREDALFFHIPHSPELTVTEYFRLIAPDRLEVRMISEDSNALEKPYEVTFEYKPAEDYKVSEYICVNNRYQDIDGKSVLDINP